MKGRCYCAAEILMLSVSDYILGMNCEPNWVFWRGNWTSSSGGSPKKGAFCRQLQNFPKCMG